MTTRKRKNWFVTIATLIAVAILAINNQDKVKEWADKAGAGKLIK